MDHGSVRIGLHRCRICNPHVLAADMRNIVDGLDALAFEVDLDDDEMVTDAIILARVTRMSDGRTSMVMTKSEGSDIVTTTGLIHCGLEIHSAADWCPVDDDED